MKAISVVMAVVLLAGVGLVMVDAGSAYAAQGQLTVTNPAPQTPPGRSIEASQADQDRQNQNVALMNEAENRDEARNRRAASANIAATMIVQLSGDLTPNVPQVSINLYDDGSVLITGQNGRQYRGRAGDYIDAGNGIFWVVREGSEGKIASVERYQGINNRKCLVNERIYNDSQVLTRGRNILNDSNGNVTFQESVEYDAAGHVIVSTTDTGALRTVNTNTYQGGSLVSTTSQSFAAGRLYADQVTTYYPTGAIQGIVANYYLNDAAGSGVIHTEATYKIGGARLSLIVTTERFHPNGHVKSRENISYNANDGKILRSYDTFNEQNICTSSVRETFFGGGKNVKLRVVTSYFADGRVATIHSEQFNDDKEKVLTTHQEFYQNGNEKSLEWIKYDDGTKVSRGLGEFDEQHNLVRNSTETFYGNGVLKSQYVEGFTDGKRNYSWQLTYDREDRSKKLIYKTYFSNGTVRSTFNINYDVKADGALHQRNGSYELFDVNGQRLWKVTQFSFANGDIRRIVDRNYSTGMKCVMVFDRSGNVVRVTESFMEY